MQYPPKKDIIIVYIYPLPEIEKQVKCQFLFILYLVFVCVSPKNSSYAKINAFRISKIKNSY